MSENIKIILGGVEYEVAPFVLRQVIKVVPEIMKISGIMSAQGMTEEALTAMANLVGEILQVPNILETRISAFDLKNAFNVIAQQAGLVQPTKEA